MKKKQLETLLEEQQQAVDFYVQLVSGVTDEEWNTPMAKGKWSPAELTVHISKGFEIAARQLKGGEGMKLLTTRWQQWVLRFTVVPVILKKGIFPKKSPAPRETRPGTITESRETVMQTLTDTSAAISMKVREQEAGGTRLTIQHAYFGTMSVRDIIRLNTQHIYHHARQLDHFLAQRS